MKWHTGQQWMSYCNGVTRAYWSLMWPRPLASHQLPLQQTFTRPTSSRSASYSSTSTWEWLSTTGWSGLQTWTYAAREQASSCSSCGSWSSSISVASFLTSFTNWWLRKLCCSTMSAGTTMPRRVIQTDWITQHLLPPKIIGQQVRILESAYHESCWCRFPDASLLMTATCSILRCLPRCDPAQNLLSVKARMNRLQNSFLPTAVRQFNDLRA